MDNNEFNDMLKQKSDKLRADLKAKMKIQVNDLRGAYNTGKTVERAFVQKADQAVKSAIPVLTQAFDVEAFFEGASKTSLTLGSMEIRDMVLLTTVVGNILKNNSEESLQKLLDDCTGDRIESMITDVEQFAKDISKTRSIFPPGSGVN